jgi:hypothetical protein
MWKAAKLVQILAIPCGKPAEVQETVCEFECSVNGAVEQLFEKADMVHCQNPPHEANACHEPLRRSRHSAKAKGGLIAGGFARGKIGTPANSVVCGDDDVQDWEEDCVRRKRKKAGWKVGVDRDGGESDGTDDRGCACGCEFRLLSEIPTISQELPTLSR